MTTDYNDIAENYQESKLQPWRTYIERYTALQLVGDVAGKAVADLACGEGYYTRLLRLLGAEHVVGVDLSAAMIDLAQAEETREPLGIEYLVGDINGLALSEKFDVVFAAYLLNYAPDRETLLQYCQAIARLLKPGGRFVAVNNNPCDPPSNFATGREYGFSKTLVGEWVEGAPIVYTFFLPEGEFEVTNYYLSRETMDQTFLAAGLRETRWHAPQVAPEGVKKRGASYWTPLLEQPAITFIDCIK